MPPSDNNDDLDIAHALSSEMPMAPRLPLPTFLVMEEKEERQPAQESPEQERHCMPPPFPVRIGRRKPKTIVGELLRQHFGKSMSSVSRSRTINFLACRIRIERDKATRERNPQVFAAVLAHDLWENLERLGVKTTYTSQDATQGKLSVSRLLDQILPFFLRF